MIVILIISFIGVSYCHPQIQSIPKNALVENQREQQCAKIPPWIRNSMNRVQPYIVQGQKAIAPIPWQVHLCVERIEQPDWCFCGGTIIDEKTILTAAHCVADTMKTPVSMNYIVAGIVSGIDSDHKSYVREIMIHEEYNDETIDNDVAILKLRSALIFDENVQPACLPDPKFAPENTEEIAVLSGWGDMRSGSGKGSEILGFLPQPLIPREKCAAPYTNYELDDSPYKITTSMICAGNFEGQKGGCQGDSGGPLVVPKSSEDDTAIIIGIVSWGFGCAEPKSPGVYAHVPKFINWIKNKMEGKYLRNCETPSKVGNGYCEDETNTPQCNYDGGDCCGFCVKNQFCSSCACLNGGFGVDFSLDLVGNCDNQSTEQVLNSEDESTYKKPLVT